MPASRSSPAAIRRLLHQQPWEGFAKALDALTRHNARLALAAVRADLRTSTSPMWTSFHREHERKLRHALRTLEDARTATRVRAHAEVFDARPSSRFGGPELQRRLWMRRWGLKRAERGSPRLRGEALRLVLHWVAESYLELTSVHALHWWRLAADAGDGDAASWVAYAFDERSESPRSRRGDAAAAVRWNMRAVALGKADAALAVGYALFYGIGIRRDRRAAAAWYQRAAEDPGARSRDWVRKMDPLAAMTNLGRMYRKGEGVRKSWPLAIRWFARAARLGSQVGAHFLAEIYSGNEGPPARPRLELVWRRIAARRGCADCRKTLGIYLWNGKRLRRNRPLALRLYEQAARADDTWAMYLLGLAYREIDPPRRDLALSRRWLRRAAARGVKLAQRALRKRTSR